MILVVKYSEWYEFYSSFINFGSSLQITNLLNCLKLTPNVALIHCQVYDHYRCMRCCVVGVIAYQRERCDRLVQAYHTEQTELARFDEELKQLQRQIEETHRENSANLDTVSINTCIFIVSL